MNSIYLVIVQKHDRVHDQGIGVRSESRIESHCEQKSIRQALATTGSTRVRY